MAQHPDGRFLAVNESRGRGWWLPAGFVEPGDDLMTAAIRETQEEAGIDVKLEGTNTFVLMQRTQRTHNLLLCRHSANRAFTNGLQVQMPCRLLCSTNRPKPTTQVGAGQGIRRSRYDVDLLQPPSCIVLTNPNFLIKPG